MTVPLRFRGVLQDHNVWSDLLVQWNPTGNVFSSKQDFFDDMYLWCLLYKERTETKQPPDVGI